MSATASPQVQLAQDPSTSDEAWGRWVKNLGVGIALAIPLMTAALTVVILAVTGWDTAEAVVIAFWASLWAGVFLGGTAGSAYFSAREES